MMMGWNPKFRLPLGAVVRVFPNGTSFFYAEQLLRISCDVSNTEIDPEASAVPHINRDNSLQPLILQKQQLWMMQLALFQIQQKKTATNCQCLLLM